MYFCRQPPPERAVTCLRSLHYSLNTPVVAIENLAVGPARAAIGVQDLGAGRASLMLVVRSQRTGQLACFSHGEAHESEESTQIALDGALTFGESMGFLFDEDAVAELGAEGPHEAALAWNELLGLTPGDVETAPAQSDEEALEVDADAGQGDDLETDADAGQDADLEIDPEPAPGDAPADLWLDDPVVIPVAARAAEPEALPAVLLTKFRRPAAAGQAATRNGWPIRLLSHF